MPSPREEFIITEPDRKLPFLRGAWDKVPSMIRRPIVWSMRSERVRLLVLDRLGIRSESDFFPLSSGGSQAIDVALAHLKAARVPGDYLEFGLFRGYTFWYAQRAADRAGLSSMSFYGFDSFEGLPEVEGADRKAAIFVSGDYRCTKVEVERQLTEHGFDWNRASLVEGYFDVSLTKEVKEAHGMGPAAIVMIDCDLYQSTVPVLAFVSDILQEGTILLFDDWYCFGEAEDQGEPRAFREFLSAHPEWKAEPFVRFPSYGRGFVMHRSPAETDMPSKNG